MLLEMTNSTAYCTEDLCALVMACLRHYGAQTERQVTVIYSRRPFSSGLAQLPCNGREGAKIRLRVPRLNKLEGRPAGVLSVARVLGHEVAHTVGMRHRDMRKDLRRCRQEVPWAEGLVLRAHPDGEEFSRRAETPPASRGGSRPGAGRPRLGIGETAQVAVRLPVELLSALDSLIARRGLKDRSDAIRHLIEEAGRR